MSLRAFHYVLPFSVLIATIVLVPIKVFDAKGLPRYLALKSELVRAKEQTDKLKEEVRQLRVDMEALRSDPMAIERVARESLGYVRADEIVFQFAK